MHLLQIVRVGGGSVAWGKWYVCVNTAALGVTLAVHGGGTARLVYKTLASRFRRTL